MKVTVCEMSNDKTTFAQQWEGLVAHVRQAESDLIVLPEMPFAPWPAWTAEVDSAVWLASIEAHAAWQPRLAEVAPAAVAASRPVVQASVPRHEAFVWHAKNGDQPAHLKHYLPNEAGFWEASWYEPGPNDFSAVATEQAKLGFLMCTEIWFTEHARAYAQQGVQILICPRATEYSSAEKWVMGGRAAAVMGGAFCLSSNRAGEDAHGTVWGGHGWIIDPDGLVLGLTSAEQPYLTLEIDLDAADAAKNTYPRYLYCR